MKKHSLRICVLLFAAVLTALCLTVAASAAEKSLSLPKTVYGQNEDILVTAVGEGTDWVGIFAKGETPGNPASIYWYYVAQDAEPERPDTADTGNLGGVYNYGRKRSPLIFMARDGLWRLSGWKHSGMLEWARAFKPEVIFFASGDYAFPYRVVRYLAGQLQIPYGKMGERQPSDNGLPD